MLLGRFATPERALDRDHGGREGDGAKGDAAHIEGKPARFVPTLIALRLARSISTETSAAARRGLLLVMLALCATTTGLMVVFSYVQRDMSTALSGKDVPGFYAAVNRYLLVIVIAAPLFAVYQYVQSLVALEWRLWLTRLLLRKYFANHAYFALKAEGTTDNPDQRICDDVRNFVDSCTSVLLAVAQKTLSMGAFFGVLWGISPNLVAFCFLYSLFGTVVTTRVFGAKLMGLHFLALRCEADLRFQLVRAREHAESVALYRGAARELAAARAKLAAAARCCARSNGAVPSRSSPTRTSSPRSRYRSHHRPRFFARSRSGGHASRVRVSNRAGGAQHRRRALRAALGARRGDGAPGTTLGDA